MPLAGHDFGLVIVRARDRISIHMPLAGHDTETDSIGQRSPISIHMPLAGHDLVDPPFMTPE